MRNKHADTRSCFTAQNIIAILRMYHRNRKHHETRILHKRLKHYFCEKESFSLGQIWYELTHSSGNILLRWRWGHTLHLYTGLLSFDNQLGLLRNVVAAATQRVSASLTTASSLPSLVDPAAPAEVAGHDGGREEQRQTADRQPRHQGRATGAPRTTLITGSYH